MSHPSPWYENKPARHATEPVAGDETGSPPPPAPPANTAASGGGVRSAATLRPTISFRCQLAQRLRDAVGSRSNRFIATVTGYNEETVRRYLRDGGPSAEFLASVCREFGVCADWLLLGVGPMRPANREAQPPAASTAIGDFPGGSMGHALAPLPPRISRPASVESPATGSAD